MLKYLPFCLIFSLQAAELRLMEKPITVNGKEAVVFSVEGLRIKNGQPFDVELCNQLKVPSSIHWHGLVLPNNQDGVAFITQFPLYPGESYHYRFPLVQSGTFWMHAHYGLQEQRLLAAPLIIEGPDDDKIAERDVVMMLADFSFKDPLEIYNGLKCRNTMEMKTDLIDVEYDAFLTNNRTLQNPEVAEVLPGRKVRLRVINGSSATNFFVRLGMEGELIAVDGNRIEALKGSLFEIAAAQRLDIVVQIPEQGGAFPILAEGEGTKMQTGLVLATKNAAIPAFSQKIPTAAGALTNEQEKKLRALYPLTDKVPNKKITIELGGNMSNYSWTLNGQSWPESTPLVVDKGDRVELVFKNVSTMSHPMHLHGHVFQVVAIDGVSFKGAMRDTVLVAPGSTIAIQFDATNPGVWPLHCHILYHMEAGMFTVVRYSGFEQPL